MHWSYVFLALTHQYEICVSMDAEIGLIDVAMGYHSGAIYHIN